MASNLSVATRSRRTPSRAHSASARSSPAAFPLQKIAFASRFVWWIRSAVRSSPARRSNAQKASCLLCRIPLPLRFRLHCANDLAQRSRLVQVVLQRAVRKHGSCCNGRRRFATAFVSGLGPARQPSGSCKAVLLPLQRNARTPAGPSRSCFGDGWLTTWRVSHGAGARSEALLVGSRLRNGCGVLTRMRVGHLLSHP